MSINNSLSQCLLKVKVAYNLIESFLGISLKILKDKNCSQDLYFYLKCRGYTAVYDNSYNGRFKRIVYTMILGQEHVCVIDDNNLDMLSNLRIDISSSTLMGYVEPDKNKLSIEYGDYKQWRPFNQSEFFMMVNNSIVIESVFNYVNVSELLTKRPNIVIKPPITEFMKENKLTLTDHGFRRFFLYSIEGLVSLCLDGIDIFDGTEIGKKSILLSGVSGSKNSDNKLVYHQHPLSGVKLNGDSSMILRDNWWYKLYYNNLMIPFSLEDFKDLMPRCHYCLNPQKREIEHDFLFKFVSRQGYIKSEKILITIINSCVNKINICKKFFNKCRLRSKISLTKVCKIVNLYLKLLKVSDRDMSKKTMRLSDNIINRSKMKFRKHNIVFPKDDVNLFLFMLRQNAYKKVNLKDALNSEITKVKITPEVVTGGDGVVLNEEDVYVVTSEVCYEAKTISKNELRMKFKEDKSIEDLFVIFNYWRSLRRSRYKRLYIDIKEFERMILTKKPIKKRFINIIGFLRRVMSGKYIDGDKRIFKIFGIKNVSSHTHKELGNVRVNKVLEFSKINIEMIKENYVSWIEEQRESLTALERLVKQKRGNTIGKIRDNTSKLYPTKIISDSFRYGSKASFEFYRGYNLSAMKKHFAETGNYISSLTIEEFDNLYKEKEILSPGFFGDNNDY